MSDSKDSMVVEIELPDSLDDAIVDIVKRGLTHAETREDFIEGAIGTMVAMIRAATEFKGDPAIVIRGNGDTFRLLRIESALLKPRVRLPDPDNRKLH